MSSRRQGISGDVLLVAITHGLLIATILVVAMFKGCAEPAPSTIAMELFVEPPPDDSDDQPSPPKDDIKPPEPEPDKNDIPEPEKEKKVEPKKLPPKKVEPKKIEPKKNKIEVNKTLVRRPPTKRKSNLTAAEIQRLLDKGAKIGKPTLSDKDLRSLLNSDRRYGNGQSMTQEMVYRDIIEQTMYRAWDQPTSLGIAGLVARVEFTFNPDGSIASSRMTGPSGNPTMDESVMRAARSVRRITGVPADYFISHRRISVAFELTGGG